jgi:hypothetical protein
MIPFNIIYTHRSTGKIEFVTQNLGAGYCFGGAADPIVIEGPAAALDMVRSIQQRLDALPRTFVTRLRAVPARNLTGADFADQGDRIALATLGYFSVDLPFHRRARMLRADKVALIDAAYRARGTNRTTEHNRIGHIIAAEGDTGGVWVWSTGRYAAACKALDDVVLSGPLMRRTRMEIAQIDKELALIAKAANRETVEALEEV